ncbi:T9SS type B sorting domain-containing protein, partial [Flavobacterium laiguense]
GFAPNGNEVNDNSGDSANEDGDNVIRICTTASIAITKDGTYQDTNNDGITNVGDVVSYNFVITNTGNVTLTNVTVTDINAVIAGVSIPTLGVGATDSTTFSGYHTITQNDINKGFVYNWATANSKDPKDNPVTHTSTDPTPCTSCPKDPECPDCTITPLTKSIIQATNDTFSVTQCSIPEEIRNALSNDLLNGVVANPADLKFKLLTALGQYIKIDEQGNITFIKGVAAGQYSFDYQICEAVNPTNCSTATITINVAGIDSVTITVPENQSPCNADTTLVDLFSFLPQGTPTNGTWVDTDNTGRLNANIFDPFGISISPVNTYHFEYKIAGDCPRSIFLVMDINDDCKVLPCKTIIIHNAFSSNEDGRNDYFQIENLEDNDCYRNIRLEVFNRWGVLVFEKDNYNNQGNAFRGYSEGRTTINKREGLPTGTYFYILSYETVDGLGQAQNVKKDGYLYLIK